MLSHCPACFAFDFDRRGITNDNTDCSVDVWRTVTFPLLRQLTGVEDGFELKVWLRQMLYCIFGAVVCWCWRCGVLLLQLRAPRLVHSNLQLQTAAAVCLTSTRRW